MKETGPSSAARTDRSLPPCSCDSVHGPVGQPLVLAQQSGESISNEITAIPRVQEAFELEGALVTIDAMGCQKEIASQIIDQKTDYLLTLKSQPLNAYKAVQAHFADRCFRPGAPKPGDSALRNIALNLLKSDATATTSFRGRRKRAGERCLHEHTPPRQSHALAPERPPG